MNRIVICGGGAHCKVVLDILGRDSRFEIVGIVDRSAQEPLGYPIIGKDEDLPAIYASGVTHAFVAIGDNALRARLINHCLVLGFEIPSVIADDAVISPWSKTGRGVLINHGVIVNAEAEVGDGVILNTSCSVDHDCHIGDFVHIAPGAHIAGSTSIGNETLIGAGASVIDKITIGSRAVIGAGAAVVSDIPAGCTAVGVPARVIKKSYEG